MSNNPAIIPGQASDTGSAMTKKNSSQSTALSQKDSQQQKSSALLHEDSNRKMRTKLDSLLRVPDDIYQLYKLSNSLTGALKDGGAGISSHSGGNKLSSGGLSSQVWTCGQNSYGELGHNDLNLRRAFSHVVYFEGKNITSLGAGNEHSVFISESGKTYAAGYNDNGQVC